VEDNVPSPTKPHPHPAIQPRFTMQSLSCA
jgi:hypothetical protein